MGFTIQSVLAAHAAGKKLTDTIEETYARIAAHDDPALFIALRPKAEALALAVSIQAAGPEAKPLFGVPFVVKDNIDVAGLPTTAACPAFEYQPERSAFVVERLERAGAIVIGKTNLDQFATGLVGVRSPYGVPRNALRADLIPGGSSSGSATAVGAGLTPFSLGTDTAGSGRVPAALNGVVGLKPTLGALSMTGVAPACRTLDTVSIFALDVADAFLVYQIAAGFDAADPWSRAFAAPALSAAPKHFRVGVPRASQLKFFDDGEAQAAFERDIAALVSLGAKIVEFDMEPFYAVARLLYEGPWVAERYAATMPLIETNPGALHPVTRAIIEGARKHDAVAAFQATYKLAALRRQSAAVWAAFEIMAVPTMPRPYTIAEVEADPIALNSNLGTYTNFVNLLDLSAIAAPSGMRADGLPSSLTLIGPAGADGFLAGVAAQVQAHSGVTMGATGLAVEAPASAPMQAPPGRIEIAAVGAHLSGLPLNRELVELGGILLREVETVPSYRLYALPGAVPAKPGLLRVTPEEGVSIKAEIWALDAKAFGAFVAAIPSPLGIGTLSFTDGTSAKGFLVEAEAVKGAKDVTQFGGWRAYIGSL
ncbi:allophanate hydrolase [Methylocapsa sp. S129]|uniref:allophanate hydrolase n=1 Tax=Methylocapsa sp. S129 TaxID=1641869 RepID=UPI00131C8D36|nr:allophanate hydrolase [Methylocapsa sp. S129]